ncbi:hypothetical protein [Clavibacter sp. VKM Ac-2872]|uniref:hypothetical protein n=1 Tax=Clavibacter sp. VKM Ac-2872 TaxID=2783812 RepID=UPI00188C6626|nr:hypothetical protein [Clavibacter sp. VKM Ac-2872]MBF4622730.1 hypothetical protein [Clavibacter sp. VKM Ac-2872]
MKRFTALDIVYLVILAGVGTLSVVLPGERALVQRMAIGATAVLLIVAFLEHRARKRREEPRATSHDRGEDDRADTPPAT